MDDEELEDLCDDELDDEERVRRKLHRSNTQDTVGSELKILTPQVVPPVLYSGLSLTPGSLRIKIDR